MSNWLSNPQPLVDVKVGNIVRLMLEDGFRYQLKCSVIGVSDATSYELQVLAVFNVNDEAEITGGNIVNEYQGKKMTVPREMVFPVVRHAP